MDRFIQASSKQRPLDILKIYARKSNKKNMEYALELGCGAGANAAYLGKCGYVVEALDINDRALEITSKRCKKIPVSTIKKDIEEYKIKPKKYSVILCWNLLSWVNKEVANKVIRNAMKGLKKGQGHLILSVFGEEDKWSKQGRVSFWKTKELVQIVKADKITYLKEKKFKSKSATGEPKFCHLIEAVVKRT